MKYCNACFEVLPVSEFYPNTNKRVGYYRAYCKECDKAKSWERAKIRKAVQQWMKESA